MTFAIALVWKASLLLAVAFALSRLFARRSAAQRHAVWTCAAVALLALPVAQALTPPLPAPLPLPRVASKPVAPPSEELQVPAHVAPMKRAASSAEVVSKAAPLPRRIDWPLLAFAFWAGGALLVVARLLLGRVARLKFTRDARPLEDGKWLEQARDIAGELGIRRRVRFLLAANGATPMTWGTLRPTVLLPASALRWPVEQRRAFLVHELGHVARFDCAIQDLADLACALYWVHPGAWYAAHRLRVEREQACDDLVLVHGAPADAYAGQLLEVVRASRVTRVLPGAAMAAPSQLQERVRALLDGARDRSRVTRGRALAGAGLAAALLLPLAAVVPAASKTVKPSPPAEERWTNAGSRRSRAASRPGSAMPSTPTGSRKARCSSRTARAGTRRTSSRARSRSPTASRATPTMP